MNETVKFLEAMKLWRSPDCPAIGEADRCSGCPEICQFAKPQASARAVTGRMNELNGLVVLTMIDC